MKTQSLEPISSCNDLHFFYGLLLQYETELRHNPIGYSENRVKKFMRKKKIALITVDGKTQIVAHNDKNKCVFSSYQSKYVDLIRHIRNAFAHGLLCKANNQTYLIQDYKDSKRTKLSMYGRINAKLLKELVELFKTTRKPQQ